jgi:ribosomal protein L28
MAYRCFNCEKGNWSGSRSQHHKGVAGGSWKHKAQNSPKLFKANLHAIRIEVAGNMQRVKLCTDCISLVRKAQKATTKPVISA